MEFSRQEYQSGLQFPSPGDLPNPGIEPRSPTLLVGSLPDQPRGKPCFNKFITLVKISQISFLNATVPSTLAPSILLLLLLYSHEVMSDSFAIPWTIACQAPLAMGFPGQEYRSGLQFPSPGDLPDPGVEPTSPAL